MIPLASPVMVVSWPWSAGELVIAIATAAVAIARHVALSARSDGDDAARERSLLRRAELRAAFGAGGRVLAMVAGAILIAWLAFAATPAARAPAWAFAAGVIVAAAAAAVVGQLEESARARVAATVAPAAVDVAWEGGRIAAFTVGAAQIGATWLLAAITDSAQAPLGMAAGMALVAAFAHFDGRVRSVAPATVRALGLMSVQSLALAAAAAAAASITSGPFGRDRPDLVHFARVLVALGPVALLALRIDAGSAEGRTLARRIAVPAVALLGFGLLAGLFVAPVPPNVGTPAAGWSALAAAILAGIALVVAVARAADHAAEADPAGVDVAVAIPASRFLGGLLLAAALVVAAAAGGYGVALAAAAAAAVLPGCVAAGFGAELLPERGDGRPAPGSDAERAASSAGVALAGLALLMAARRSKGGLDLLSADVAAGAVVGAVVVLFIAASWRRSGSGGGANSTATGRRAMILPALLAVAAPFCAARLNPAAGGGMAVGALLCGAIAALLAPRTTAALFDRVVSLLCITFVLCAR